MGKLKDEKNEEAVDEASTDLTLAESIQVSIVAAETEDPPPMFTRNQELVVQQEDPPSPLQQLYEDEVVDRLASLRDALRAGRVTNRFLVHWMNRTWPKIREFKEQLP